MGVPNLKTRICEAINNEKTMLETTSNSRSWKPLSLRSPVLTIVLILTAALIGILGYLDWQTSRNGAILTSASPDGFSMLQIFLFRYMPTIIIVIYGIIWNWIDLDVKRMEPWFQLSKPDGAGAEYSLLLQYPADFLPLVPLKACRKRQWSVASASMSMVFVAWAITPLQNGIFQVNPLTLNQTTSLRFSNSLVNMTDQNTLLNGNFMKTAYTTIWLGQSLPEFTTMNYTLAPFEYDTSIDIPGENKTLTAQTLGYSLDLSCTPAQNITLSQAGEISLSDGRGCNAEAVITIPDTEFAAEFNSYYIGYPDDPHASTSLQASGCPSTSKHTFLAIWKRTTADMRLLPSGVNMTAIFCEADYYTQSMVATISLDGNQVQNTTPQGSKRTLDDSQFNSTLFEYIVANGFPPSQLQHDVFSTTSLHQDTQVKNMSVVVPITNVMAFALGTTQLPPEDYLNISTLKDSIEKAYRMLFAFAAHSIVAPATTDNTSFGTISSISLAVSTVPLFIYLSETFLILVFIFAAILLYLNSNRHLELSRDPGKLAELMLLARRPDLRHAFDRYTQAPCRILAAALTAYKFRLCSRPTELAPCIEMTTNEMERPIVKRLSSQALSIRDADQPRVVQPPEYNRMLGLAIGVLLATLLAALVALYQISRAQNGLPLPSQNLVIQQILLNFVPSILATVLEPFWVLLSRVACIMQPLEELKNGNARAKASLLTNYSSLPPQLAAWKALSCTHLILMSLSVVAVIANVFTVALSGLFSIQRTVIATSNPVQALYQPQLTSFNVPGPDNLYAEYNQDDANFILNANLSSTDLPAWVTPHYYFLPVGLNELTSDVISTDQFSFQHTGYGADLYCVELSSQLPNASYEFLLTNGMDLQSFNITYYNSDGSITECKPNNNQFSANGTLLNGSGTFGAIGGQVGSRAAFEMTGNVAELHPTTLDASADRCTPYFVRGWVRATTTKSSDTSNTTISNVTSLETTFISCLPRIKAADFNISVSAGGHINSMVQTSEVIYISAHSSSVNFSSAINQTLQSLNSGSLSWHEDALATDWNNYFIGVLTNSSAFVDPALPPPSATNAIALTSEVFSRLFVAQLSLMASKLTPASDDQSNVPAQILRLQQRVYMSQPLFWISVSILCIDLLVVIIFYTRLPKPFLPRIPGSIASQLAFFAGSRIVEDAYKAAFDKAEDQKVDFSDMLSQLDEQGWRYSYGKYIGSDGWAHTGIERAPFVLNLRGDNNMVKRRKWWKP